MKALKEERYLTLENSCLIRDEFQTGSSINSIPSELKSNRLIQLEQESQLPSKAPNPYEDPFSSREIVKAKEAPSKERSEVEKEAHGMIEYPKFPSPLPTDSKELCKTKFVKFRDVKHLESYDTGAREEIEHGEVLNPLKESLASMGDSEDTRASQDRVSFSIKKSCFERVENKLVYALTEAFREGERADLDPELSALVHEILHQPGEPEPVVGFFRKGLEELDLSQRHLWKFFKVCRQFLKVERENFARRQERSFKSLRDFAVRRFVKETEITVVRQHKPVASFFGDEVSMAGSSSRSLKTLRRNHSATRITPSIQRKGFVSPNPSKNRDFYLLRREDGASWRRRHLPRSQRLPKIYIKPLLMKLFKATDSKNRLPRSEDSLSSNDPAKRPAGKVLVSAVTFLQDFSASQMEQSASYDTEGKVFGMLENRGFVVVSVANLLEAFEMMFDTHHGLFEIEVKVKLVEFFLKNRFHNIEQQISETFAELNISGFFKDIHQIQDNSQHK